MKTSYVLDGAGVNGELDLNVELSSKVISDLMSRLVRNKWRFSINTSEYDGDVWLKTDDSSKNHIETIVSEVKSEDNRASMTSVRKRRAKSVISVYAGERRLFSFFHMEKGGAVDKKRYFLCVDFSPTLAFSGQNSQSVALEDGTNGHTYSSVMGMLMFPFKVLESIMGKPNGFFKAERILVASIQLATYSQEFESVEERDMVLIDLYNRYCGKLGSSQLKINSCAEMLGLETRNHLSSYYKDVDGVGHLTGFALLKNKGKNSPRYSMLGVYAKDWKNLEILKSKLEEKKKEDNNRDKSEEEIIASIKKKMRWNEKVQAKVALRIRFDFTLFGNYFRPVGLSTTENPQYSPSLVEVVEKLTDLNHKEFSTVFRDLIINEYGLYKLFGAQPDRSGGFKFVDFKGIKNYLKTNYPLFWAEYSSLVSFNKEGRIKRLATELAKDTSKNAPINSSSYLKDFYSKILEETGFDLENAIPRQVYVLAKGNSEAGFKNIEYVEDLKEDMEDGSNQAGDLILDYEKELTKKSRKLAINFLSNFKFTQIPTRVLDGVDLT